MALADLQAALAAVDTAIKKEYERRAALAVAGHPLTPESASVGGRTIVPADLKKLQEERKMLLAAIALESPPEGEIIVRSG